VSLSSPHVVARLTTLVVLVGAIASCSGTSSTLPPLGEVVIAVDTDLPIAFANRLRIDVFEDGTWIESRDLVRPSVGSWPASFSVYSPDPQVGRVATVRLRAYPDGRTREYHGERFAPRDPAIFAPGDRANIDGDELPRLLRDGVDLTPKDEPVPLATVDRLVRVRVIPGEQSLVPVVLRGECIGTMADLSHEETCIDRDGQRVSLVEEATSPLAALPPSLVGSFPAPRPCTVDARPEAVDEAGLPLRDEEACVPGGMFLFGTPYSGGLIQDEGVGIPAVMSPFLIDKWEVTVARFRRAVNEGFVPPSNDPVRNEGPIITTDPDLPVTSPTLCSYSTTPRGREDFALSCMSPQVAQAFCQFSGGDLPTEAQWYFAAVVVDRPAQTAYPWGEDNPDCERAVFGRIAGDIGVCASLEGVGPARVDAAPMDASIALGLIGMHGGVGEWTRDQSHHLYEGCWYTATLRDPACADDTARTQAVGGISWRQYSVPHDTRQSWSRTQRPNHLGFRCARKGSVDP